jgi:hypothetical protein
MPSVIMPSSSFSSLIVLFLFIVDDI